MNKDITEIVKKIKGSRTVREFASEAGISTATASKYLTGHGEGAYTLETVAKMLRPEAKPQASFTQDELFAALGVNCLPDNERPLTTETLITFANTEDNNTDVRVSGKLLIDCLLEDIISLKPEDAAPAPVIKAWLECTGEYHYPDSETPEYETFSVTYAPKGSPYGTAMAQIKKWETDDDILQRCNATYIEMPHEEVNDSVEMLIEKAYKACWSLHCNIPLMSNDSPELEEILAEAKNFIQAVENAGYAFEEVSL